MGLVCLSVHGTCLSVRPWDLSVRSLGLTLFPFIGLVCPSDDDDDDYGFVASWMDDDDAGVSCFDGLCVSLFAD